jgi:hypothetical protein
VQPGLPRPTIHDPHLRGRAIMRGTMAMRAIKGVRVYSWSPMEQKAFEGFFYEAKKLATMYGTNIGSLWSSGIPAFGLAYAAITYCNWKSKDDALHHRD